MEIITGVERRRQWRGEEKVRVLPAPGQPRGKFSPVARRHDISRSLLWQWRDARRRGGLVAETPAFVPLQVVPELPAPEAREGSDPTRCIGPPEPDSRIEIVLPDGTAVRVTEAISAAALRRVLAALRG